MSDPNSKDSLQESVSAIKRDLEATSADVAHTIEQLTERVSPTRLVDDAVGYFRNSGAPAAISNLGGRIRSNPVPLLLIGVGAIWFLSSSASSSTSSGRRMPARSRPSARGVPASASSSGHASSYSYSGQSDNGVQPVDEGNSTAGMHGDKSPSPSHLLSAQRSKLEAVLGPIGEQLGDRVTQLAEDARARGTQLAHYTQDRWTFLTVEQPLVLASIGFAVGAALGAAAPTTDAERQLMGEASNNVKRRLRDGASEQIGQARSAAAGALTEVMGDLGERGYSVDNLKHAVEDVTERLRSGEHATA